MYHSGMPEWTVEQTQAKLKEISYDLLELEDRLLLIRDSLPIPPNVDAMLEGLEPYDVATDIFGSIECVVDDCLSPAIRTLEKAAEITNEDLRREFRKRRI
jgi:hypothetical protein